MSDDISLPALMRAARATYGAAIRAALADAGYDDLPRNGAFVLGALARAGAPLGDVIAGLGVSKQAGGALVDVLVTRAYLDRTADPDDRRRLRVTLTVRGEETADIVRATIAQVDASLVEAVGAQRVADTRATLLALATHG